MALSTVGLLCIFALIGCVQNEVQYAAKSQKNQAQPKRILENESICLKKTEKVIMDIGWNKDADPPYYTLPQTIINITECHVNSQLENNESFKCTPHQLRHEIYFRVGNESCFNRAKLSRDPIMDSCEATIVTSRKRSYLPGENEVYASQFRNYFPLKPKYRNEIPYYRRNWPMA